MKQENIKGYIEMAIENGVYKSDSFDLVDHYVYLLHQDIYMFEGNIIELFTSKPFIEAIARGVAESKGYSEYTDGWLDAHTSEQAMAIRDGTMDEYIENLLNK